MGRKLLLLMVFMLTNLIGRNVPPVPYEAVAAAQVIGSENTDAFLPNWRLGDSWIVETQSRQIQAGESEGARRAGVIVQWQFTVLAREKVDGRDCFRTVAQSIPKDGQQSKVTLWVDAAAFVLHQIQVQVRAGGELRTLTESYEHPGDQPVPVMGPLTALPIELPLFLGGQAKGSQKFIYESISGPTGTKAIGDLGFVFQIEQSIVLPKSALVKELLHEDFVKGLPSQPALRVELKTIDQLVWQVWQPGLPWAAYSDNGVTISRLKKVIPAQSAERK